MTLGRRLTVTTAMLISGIVLLGAASISGLAGLREHARIARDEYVELRMIQRAEAFVEDLHGRTRSIGFDTGQARNELQSAIQILDEFLAFQETQTGADPRHQEVELLGSTAARAQLLALRDGISHADGLELTAQAKIESALRELERLATQMDQLIARTHESAASQLHASIVSISLLAALLAFSAIILGYFHHRSIMNPLRRLQSAMRSIAAGRFSERVAAAGDAELVALSDDLNRMAGELEGVYRNLEDKVRAKSRELVRSERLASVGFLAAGVAHEINNPLNIMSGYAELALSRLRKSIDEDAVTETCESLQIIRDEAFRCKDIVQKLLSLAKMGDGDRTTLSLAHVLDEVVYMVRAVKNYRDRTLELSIANGDLLQIIGNESELKQVVLNLVINAMNAIKPGTGHVVVQGERQEGYVVVRVVDNGCGMTSETAEHVFEPFFTLGSGETGRGAGLGLSITHAIVEAHGGSIAAESDGLGCGSRFTVRLPVETISETHGKAA